MFLLKIIPLILIMQFQVKSVFPQPSACAIYDCNDLDLFYYGSTDGYWSSCHLHYFSSPCQGGFQCCINNCGGLVCYEP
ncbi:UNVERIFIED_CONTAM: hypothetical protein RMT77_005488 [Armadillidium vulgare]|nr:hypothetical protein Avbf_11785 [Armadillidium vulgare]